MIRWLCPLALAPLLYGAVSVVWGHEAETGWDYDEQAGGYACCGDRDCRPILDGEVEFTANGWQISPPPGHNLLDRNRLLGEDDFRIFDSGDRLMHICYNGSKTYIRCLFIPAGKG